MTGPELASFIQREIKLRGLTEYAVLERAGVNKTILTRWATRAMPNLDTLCRVLGAIDMDFTITRRCYSRLEMSADDINAMMEIVMGLPLAEAALLIHKQTGEGLSYSLALAKTIHKRVKKNARDNNISSIQPSAVRTAA